MPIRAGLGHTSSPTPEDAGRALALLSVKCKFESDWGVRRNAMRWYARTVVAAMALAAACGVATAVEKERIVVTHKYQKSMRGKIGEFPILILRAYGEVTATSGSRASC
jgi:hypothetical protein